MSATSKVKRTKSSISKSKGCCAENFALALAESERLKMELTVQRNRIDDLWLTVIGLEDAYVDRSAEYFVVKCLAVAAVFISTVVAVAVYCY